MFTPIPLMSDSVPHIHYPKPRTIYLYMFTLNISFNDDPPMIQNDTKDGSEKDLLFLDLGPSHLKICQHRWNSQGDPPKPAVSQIFPRDPTVLQLPVHLPPTWAVLGVKHMWPDRKLRKIGLWLNYDMTSGYTVTVYHVICGIPH